MVNFSSIKYIHLLDGINHFFMSIHVKDKNCDCVNIGVKVWTRKSDFPHGNFPRSLIYPEATIQIPFKLMLIEYDTIKGVIVSMERVGYNTAIGINFMNVYDI